MNYIEEVGFIGLGRMGFNMVSRVLDNSKLKVIVWNRSKDPIREIEKKGALGSKNVKDLVSKLGKGKKVVWLMVPSGEPTEENFQALLVLLKKGDIIIDGGNSNFHDSLRRAEDCKKKGIGFLDVGVSGGVVAAERGYAMMAGGSKEDYDFCKPLFESMCMPLGYNLVGKSGAGHYVKMIHNAIEYGMMQSIGEGFDLLKNGSFEDLDLVKIANLWNHGTIVSSFLMEMTEKALKNNDSDLSQLEPWIGENGEGEWAVLEAIEQKVPFVANSYALQVRRLSRDLGDFSFKLLAGIRNEFGGHAVHTKKGIKGGKLKTK